MTYGIMGFGIERGGDMLAEGNVRDELGRVC